MTTAPRVDSDDQLVRLLQIGVVLEEMVEARAYEHYRRLPEEERDETIETLLESVSSQSKEHRERLESLIDDLGAPTVAFEAIEDLVADQYARTRPEDFDGVLYDQMNGEATAYKFYDDLIEAIRETEREFGVDRERVIDTLEGIREEEARGVERVANLMEERA